jgi:hypothetical protein
LYANERPAISFKHDALTVIEEDFPLPEANWPAREVDKWLKIKRGLIAVRDLAPAHVMLVDADDCVHRDLAAVVAKSPEAHGWIFDRGYTHVEGTRWVVRKTEFHRYCGSSAIVRLALSDLRSALSEPVHSHFRLTQDHTIIADFMRTRGSPLAALPFAGDIYIIHHDNISGDGLSRWQSKKTFLKELVNTRPVTRMVRENFRLYDLSK